MNIYTYAVQNVCHQITSSDKRVEIMIFIFNLKKELR